MLWVLPASPLPRKITEQISALPHRMSLHVFFGQRAVNPCRTLAKRVVCSVNNLVNFVQGLLWISALHLWLTERVALDVVGRGRKVLVRMLRADNCVGRVDLTVNSLRWSFDYCLRTQPFRLYVSVATFLIIFAAPLVSL